MSDSLIITGSNYEQPTTGLQPAVFSLIEDIGITTGKYGEKNQIVIFWELSEKMREGDNEGKPFVFSEFFSKTISDRSKLGKMLASYRGKKKLDPETIKKGIDVYLLIGRHCQLNLVEDDDGKIVRDTILPLPDTMKDMAPARTLIETPDWIIKMKQKSKPDNDGYIPGSEPTDNSDLPF